MALQISLADCNVGIPCPQAYATIAHLSFDANSNVVQVAVNIYANQAAFAAGKTPVGGGVYSGAAGTDIPLLTQSLPNGVLGTLYTWLLTLPDFAGATQVA